MAKPARLWFGDKTTADVRLHLIGLTGAEYEGSPIFSHSQVLKMSEFFETKLSERLSLDKRPFEIKVRSSYGVEKYTKCIQLMYSYYADEVFYFSGVDEALAILPVASEVMFRECVKECMVYLDAVRWSREQKFELRDQLSYLQINVLPALAARLGMSQPKSDCGGLEIFKETLEELFSLNRNGSEYRSTVERHCMIDNFETRPSPAVKDACRSTLLKEFNFHVDILKSKSDEKDVTLACSALLWLIGLIERFDRKLFETVLKLFCEDPDLRNSINTRVGKNYQPSYDILNILINLFLNPLGNGRIITVASFRLSFLTNWVDTRATLMSICRRLCPTTLPHNQSPNLLMNPLQEGIAKVAETLPFLEKRLVYNIWKDAFIKRGLGISNAVNWWTDEVHEELAIGKDYII